MAANMIKRFIVKPFYEIVELDHAMKKMITAGKGTDEIRAVAVKNGAMFLADSLRELVAKGVTSLDEYKRIIYTVT